MPSFSLRSAASAIASGHGQLATVPDLLPPGSSLIEVSSRGNRAFCGSSMPNNDVPRGQLRIFNARIFLYRVVRPIPNSPAAKDLFPFVSDNARLIASRSASS